MPTNVILAVPAFLVAILGVAIALAAQKAGLGIALITITGIFAIGLVADRMANAQLPARPKTAILLFTIWGLCPGIAAATFIAVTIFLNSAFSPDELGAKGLDKQMVTTTLTAISALLTALCIKMMDDADEKVIGEHVRRAFFNRFRDSEDAEVPHDVYPVILGKSPVADLVFANSIGDDEGWGSQARWMRAKRIAAAMGDPDEVKRVADYWSAKDPPPPPQAPQA
jgi:hypothetical protein